MAATQALLNPMLLFETGGRHFALPVEEVDGLQSGASCGVDPLPAPDARVAGLMNAGGRIIAVLRFPGFARAKEADDAGAYILAHTGDLRFAFAVDRLEGVTVPGEEPAGAEPVCAAALLRSVGLEESVR